MKLRWLIIHSSQNDGSHPSAFLDNKIGYMRVLQYLEEESFGNGMSIQTWRDIPMEEKKNENL